MYQASVGPEGSITLVKYTRRSLGRAEPQQATVAVQLPRALTRPRADLRLVVRKPLAAMLGQHHTSGCAGQTSLHP
jgi:hypothetical protein